MKLKATFKDFSVFQNLAGNTGYFIVPIFYHFLSTMENKMDQSSWEKSLPTQHICIIFSLPLIWNKGNKITGHDNEVNQVLNYRIRKLLTVFKIPYSCSFQSPRVPCKIWFPFQGFSWWVHQFSKAECWQFFTNLRKIIMTFKIQK